MAEYPAYQPNGTYVAAGTAVLTATPDARFRVDRVQRGFIASLGNWTSGFPIAVGAAAGTSRSPHVMAVDACDVRLAYANSYCDTGAGNTDTDGAGTITLRASIEVAGAKYRVTFNGSATATIDPGGVIQSDPIGVQFAAGATFYVNTYVSAAAAVKANTANYSGALGTGGWVATTDLTAPGSGAVADAVAYLYTPYAILGTPTSRTTPSIIVVGDSIAIGHGDAGGEYCLFDSTKSTGGFIYRGLSTAGIPSVSVANSGDGATTFQTFAKSYRRIVWADGCTHAICQEGINDIGNTLATVQAALLVVWAMLSRRGPKVYQTTITPHTSSTDSWATTGNQTVTADEAKRVSLNTWIRGGAPTVGGVAVAVGTGGALVAGQTGHPLTGFIEVADLAETARNSGLWKVNGTANYYTSDGIHPTAVASAALAAAISGQAWPF